MANGPTTPYVPGGMQPPGSAQLSPQPQVPQGPASPVSQKVYRYPAWGDWAGDGFYPLDWLPKNYAYVLPYVVGFTVTIQSNQTTTVSYSNTSDSDFIILKQRSTARIFVDSNGNVYYLNNPGLYAAIRIANVREITSEPIAFDILFPDRYFLPFYWGTPLFLNRGESIEISLVNESPVAYNVVFSLEGIRGFERT